MPLPSLVPSLASSLLPRLRRSAAIALAVSAAFGTQDRAEAHRLEALDHPYRVVDIEHPPMVVEMVPLGATEFGAMVALGWRSGSSAVAELWVNLPSPMFGLPNGWSSLGPAPDSGIDRTAGAVRVRCPFCGDLQGDSRGEGHARTLTPDFRDSGALQH